MISSLYQPISNEEDTGLCCISYGGRTFEGIRKENGFCISRIISTNPMDYLDEKFIPGTIINLQTNSR